MGAVVVGDGNEGGICLDIGDFLCRGGSGGTYLRVVDVGYNPSHWEEAGRLPPLGVLQTDGTEAKEEAGRAMGIPPNGGGDARGGNTGGGYIFRLLPEQSNKIYCDKAYYGPVSGGGAEPWGKGVEVVVGVGVL